MESYWQSKLTASVLLLLWLWGIVPVAMAGDESRLTLLDKETFLEVASGRVWRLDRGGRLTSTAEVLTTLQALNQENDGVPWRLPTPQELYDLFAIFDMKEGGEVRIRLEGKYWLQNEQGEMVVGGWEIGDGCGPSRTYVTGRGGYLRPVRP